jgi:septal ring factor EnvC (AmiA/AmiB activator)
MKRPSASLRLVLVIAILAAACAASLILTAWSRRLNQRGPERIKLEVEINRLETQAAKLMDGIDESIHYGEHDSVPNLRKQLHELDAQISKLRKELGEF